MNISRSIKITKQTNLFDEKTNNEIKVVKKVKCELNHDHIQNYKR